MNEMQTRMPEVGLTLLCWAMSLKPVVVSVRDLTRRNGILLPMTRLLVSVHGAMVLGGMSGISACSMGSFAANLLIDKLAGCNLNADFVNSISAEARFYRAIFYYHLFMGYEQFPLIKHYLAASEMYSVAKGTREEIYEFMMGDLDDEVTKYLPQRSATQQGRVCRDAAKLLRAKNYFVPS